MADKTTIAWTDATWNPVSGCTKIPGPHGRPSGCDKCYAYTLAERFRGTPGHYYENGFDITLRPQRLDDPLRWTAPRRIFVNSMSDLFHADIPDEYIDRVFTTMRTAQRHTFQVLTKRPERMLRYAARALADNPPAPNVWLGVTIASADDAWRAADLRKTPAAIRFLSIEPLLGPVPDDVVDGMDWVIVGGESGHGARAMDETWARDVIAACRERSIPVFVKQLGAVLAASYGLHGKGEDPADWPEGLRIREYPPDR